MQNIVCLIFVVTPFMGVWIEMFAIRTLSTLSESLPLWECGLKSHIQ